MRYSCVLYIYIYLYICIIPWVGWSAFKQLNSCFSFKTDFTTNFCGPYWSDGKFQSSVEDPERKPVNRLDEACRRHDIAYAKAKGDITKLSQADLEFYNETSALTEHPIRGFVYGRVVYYGNKLARMQAGSYPINVFGNSNHGPQPLSGSPDVYDPYRTPRGSCDVCDVNDKTETIYAPVHNQPYMPVTNVIDDDTPIMREDPSNRSTKTVPMLDLSKGALNNFGGNDPYIFFNRYRISRKKPKRKGIGGRNMHRVFISS